MDGVDEVNKFDATLDVIRIHRLQAVLVDVGEKAYELRKSFEDAGYGSDPSRNIHGVVAGSLDFAAANFVDVLLVCCFVLVQEVLVGVTCQPEGESRDLFTEDSNGMDIHVRLGDETGHLDCGRSALKAHDGSKRISG